ncbi:hypothetical protein SAMN06272737_118122 [Blastococcus mobilis]|uniref:Uncharacterized protein n=1 Tax=Blastococcus mobilis TaxID=1938746 RepID=A0A238Y9K6_9ACTN|nr:hypothetical protein SAMN06272737_118122 [Blastococcus mobilis]
MSSVVVEASVRVLTRLARARVECFESVLVERAAADSLRQLSDPDWSREPFPSDLTTRSACSSRGQPVAAVSGRCPFIP